MSEADTAAAPEVRIRALAYQLWEEAGRPEGRSDYFWYRAQDLIRLKEPDQEKLSSNSIENISDRQAQFEQKKGFDEVRLRMDRIYLLEHKAVSPNWRKSIGPAFLRRPIFYRLAVWTGFFTVR